MGLWINWSFIRLGTPKSPHDLKVSHDFWETRWTKIKPSWPTVNGFCEATVLLKREHQVPCGGALKVERLGSWGQLESCLARSKEMQLISAHVQNGTVLCEAFQAQQCRGRAPVNAWRWECSSLYSATGTWNCQWQHHIRAASHCAPFPTPPTLRGCAGLLWLLLPSHCQPGCQAHHWTIARTHGSSHTWGAAEKSYKVDPCWLCWFINPNIH